MYNIIMLGQKAEIFFSVTEAQHIKKEEYNEKIIQH